MPPTVKILMADDDADDLEMIALAITESFPTTQFYSFTNGQAAVEHLTRCGDDELPQLIVLDFNMPILTGVDVLAQLKESRRLAKIPKVILSTSDAPVYVKESLKAGAVEYMVKPVSLPGLQQLAKKLLSFCHIEV